MVRFQLLNNGQDWLLSFPELNDLGFQLWIAERGGQSYIVCPDKVVWPLTIESDGCWSLTFAVYISDDGEMTMEIAGGSSYKMVSPPVFEKSCSFR